MFITEYQNETLQHRHQTRTPIYIRNTVINCKDGLENIMRIDRRIIKKIQEPQNLLGQKGIDCGADKKPNRYQT